MDTTISPLASIGIDIGREVFHIVGFSTDGRIAFRRKIERLALVETFKAASKRRWHGGMLKCSLCQQSHEPRIIPAAFLRRGSIPV